MNAGMNIAENVADAGLNGALAALAQNSSATVPVAVLGSDDPFLAQLLAINA